MLKSNKSTLDALKAPSRYVTAYAEIYFDGADQAPHKLTLSDGLMEFNILEELASGNDSPFGNVSYNELDLLIDNLDNRFTADNQNSPFYGKMVPNVVVKIIYEVEVTPDVFKKVAGGTFYAYTWKSTTTSYTINLVAYDRLSQIGEEVLLDFPVYEDTTVYQFFYDIFTTLGLRPGDDFIVDPLLQMKVPFIWLSGIPLIEDFRVLSISLGIKIYVDKLNRFRVHSATSLGEAVDSISDNDLIISVSGSNDLRTAYSRVTTNYQIANSSAPTTIIQLNELDVPLGRTIFSNLVYSKGPAIRVTGIKILDAPTGITISNYSVGAHSMSIVIDNKLTPRKVSLIVEAITLEIVQAKYALDNVELVDIMGIKEYNIGMSITTGIEFIKDYTSKVLEIVKDPQATKDIEMRGYPVTEIGDVIRVDSNIVNLHEDMHVMRIAYTFDGSLSSTCTVTKVKNLQTREWSCVSPGLYAYNTVREVQNGYFINR